METKHQLPISSIVELLKSEKKSSSIVTIKSKKTGKDFTFKIVRKIHKEKLYTHIYVETGYLEFRYLGFYDGQNIIRQHQIQENLSSKSISWCLNHLKSEEEIKKLEMLTTWYHTGHCIKCNKILTDAKSIELGIGPKCRAH